MSYKQLQLGEREISVLEILWRDGMHSAKSVREKLAENTDLALSTVQSTLERLYKKGILIREKKSHAYVYECNISRRELLGDLLDDVIGQLNNGHHEPVLSSFIDYAERLDENSLNDLERLIQKRIEERK